MSEINRLKKLLAEHERRIRFLENHARHADLISQALQFIREKEVLSLSDLRRSFPGIYGKTQTRLYDAMREDPDYRMIYGYGRGVHTILAYIKDGNPTSPKAIAFDCFQRISQRKRQICTVREIKRMYGLDDEKALEVFEIFKSLFGKRLKIRPNGKQAMTKEYYREYIKTLKTTRRRY